MPSRLKELRISDGITIAKLADLLGITRTQYNRMERGENQFKDEYLDTLATYYGVNPDELRLLQIIDNVLRIVGYGSDNERAAFLLNIVQEVVATSERHEECAVQNQVASFLSEDPNCIERRIENLSKMVKKIQLHASEIDQRMSKLGKELEHAEHTDDDRETPRRRILELDYDQQRAHAIETLLIQKIAELKRS